MFDYYLYSYTQALRSQILLSTPAQLPMTTMQRDALLLYRPATRLPSGETPLFQSQSLILRIHFQILLEDIITPSYQRQ